jgi:hypothetical protein
MDQLKQVMAQAIKHQFWIITGLATVLAIVGYFLTSSTLNKLYTDQAKLLDDRFKDVSSVSSAVSTHPNEHSKAKMQVIIDKMAADVQQAWELQYKRQEKILVWPESAIPNKRLLDKFKKYFPPETTLNYPEEPASIARNDKDKYAEYFAEQMPRIAQIIGCKWVGVPSKTSAAAGMMGMGGGGMMKGGGGSADVGYGDGGGGYGDMGGGMGGMGYGSTSGNPMMQTGPKDLVIWPKSSQDELINSMRLWKTETPTLYEILYTQENMWILEGVMNIIAKTNEGAVENFQTTIKQIEFIRIGKPAVGKAGNIDPPLSGASSGGMGSMMEMAEGGDSMMMEDGMAEAMMSGSGGLETSSDGMPGEVFSPDPANGRYVDSTFTPITGEDLRTKMKNEGGGDAYFAVAKRIPVRLRFRMDQRRLPIFLANCGNADLMLEIRQVRMGNTKAAPASGAMGGGGPMGGMMMGGPGGSSSDGYGEAGVGSEMEGSDAAGYGDMGGDMMGMGGMGGMMGMGGKGGGGMMGMGAGGRTRAKPAWEMPIEVYGVIYLYNPVDIKKLGLDKVTENTVVSDTVTPVPETPAAATPAPATPTQPSETPAASPVQPTDSTPAATPEASESTGAAPTAAQ